MKMSLKLVAAAAAVASAFALSACGDKKEAAPAKPATPAAPAAETQAFHSCLILLSELGIK